MLATILLATAPTFVIPFLGPVQAQWVTVRTDDFWSVSQRLEFRDAQGKVVLPIRIDAGGPYAMSLWEIALDGLPQPTIAVTSSWAAADRIVVEPFLVGAVDGRLVELIPDGPELEIQDAACLYPAVAGRPPLLTTIKWTTDPCVVCWPKHYVITRYFYEKGRFRRGWAFTTTKVFKEPGRVLAHYGIPCDTELVTSSESHVVKRGEPK